MKRLDLRLKNCHGIHALEALIDFRGKSAVAIYAPNGTMKTSFAQTFTDLRRGVASGDKVFPDREAERRIVDEDGVDIAPEDIVVIPSYDEDLGPSESTSTLLVHPKLRQEYDELQKRLAKARDELAVALKKHTHTRRDVVAEVARVFTAEPGAFFPALVRIEAELSEQGSAPFADIPYDVIFNDKILPLLKTADFKDALSAYVSRLNQLLDESKFFNRDSFNYYNAQTVTRTLGENGFFTAHHKLILSGADGEPLEVSNASALQGLLDDERKQIIGDATLGKKLAAIEKALTKNAEARAFWAFISQHEGLLPELANIELFEQNVWKSYIKTHEPLYLAALECLRETEERKRQIEAEAASERTQWEIVIQIFNERFFVPFLLKPRNRNDVILGQDKVLRLGFEFQDGTDNADIEREDLLTVLSNGEKKALYILNVLFEVETRKGSPRQTLFVIDDLADSFDYKNKYAIIHYLKEMSEQQNFRLLLLTHNFDFFRTLQSRGVVQYSNCLMAQRSPTRTTLSPAEGIRNPFLKIFKPHFFDEPTRRIAAIPFIRNIAEYTKGEHDANYLALTSLLHWKTQTAEITQQQLDQAFQSVFGGTGSWTDSDQPVTEMIFTLCDEALKADEGANFENKIILSIGTRLLAERHMVYAIDDEGVTGSIDSNQTHRLFTLYRDRGLGTPADRDTLDAVALMTPENIHVNSFMFEPILDISDTHLRQLYHQATFLETGQQPAPAAA